MADGIVVSKKTKMVTVFDMALIALVTAVTCVLAPISVPIGPVPVSLGTLAIYMSVYILGWKKGLVSCIVYLALGLAGLPVFSGFQGGLGKLAGPTGGYLVGYIFMVILCGLAVEQFGKGTLLHRGLQLAGMILGTIVLYAFGTAWFCVSTGTGVVPALMLCVFPFIAGDLVKMLIALSVGPVLNRQIKRIAAR